MPKNNLLKVHFSKTEDKKLKQLINIHGTSDWKLISKVMPGRNYRQCKDRWEKFLSPNINREPYTKEEDKIILQLHSKIGPQWVKIASFLNGRSDSSIKSRFKLLQRRINDNSNSLNAQNTQVSNNDEMSTYFKDFIVDNSQSAAISYDSDDIDMFFDFQIEF
ncbi:Myb-like DNA-binding domain containing protein [Trichomonas vaginalis G3]|uniref:Myb-like DNA-binding domain containing protein n=1 Tax=Trichomonas vaginalis (strain ATCC PRA-98 / G3) TaxID=412133 RepID=A2FBW2_TRIV3|nr:RNA polymerase II transcription regulator recruiting protein [Trichomonas vaginalis G3]EAX97608.1 Myb-like DNA-binding domain containing protein [Trichomonas vaginalis G3]KAI5510578.1 RNA polymerase II transcription regulator recruiting protein [Trichomonas vaginalis G3]|eukprot:XP_001310538.1 Myb-like DNA-binding domain containing protein [Trichomonas vaginalis G3]